MIVNWLLIALAGSLLVAFLMDLFDAYSDAPFECKKTERAII